MAISRIWQSGAESGDLRELGSYSTETSIVASPVRTGTYAISAQTHVQPSTFTLSFTATDQARIGFDWRSNTDTSAVWVEIARFRNSGTDIFEIQAQASTQQLRLVVNGTQRDITAAIAYEFNVWYHIGFDVKVDVSNGWAYIYRDGSLILSWDGNTGSTNVNNVIWANSTDAGTGSDLWFYYFDNLYIDNTSGEASPTAPPIKKFYYVGPNGDGNYSQWTPSSITGSHYQMVDERPPDNDTTYLEAVTGSLLDSFTMTTFTLDTNEDIVAMIPFVFAKRGSTTELISLGTRSSGTDLIGSEQTLSTSYSYYWERQITGSLGFAWTQSYLDDVEVIINSTGTY